MADRTDLEAAAAAGVISNDQIQPLHDFLKARTIPAPVAPKPTIQGEEELRFIRNFHDVFLAIGIILFAIGMGVGIGTFVSGSGNGAEHATTLTGVLAAGAAGVMWGLGELFARRRRLFLPAIAIVCAMTIFAVLAVATLYAGLIAGRGYEGSISNLEGTPPQLRIGILLALGVGVLAPLAFYFRFRLPFSLGMAGGVAALFAIVAALIANWEVALRFMPSLYLLLGALLFLAGVAFDSRDPARATRFSDNGFWLHFAAAPLILNGAFGLIGQALLGNEVAMSPSAGMIVTAGSGNSGVAALQAGITLIVVAVLGLISLLINRRALIVSALLSTGIAIGVLLNAVGLGAGALAAATLISLGALVLILGAGWHSVRRALLKWVRPDGVWARVFPPEAPPATA